MFLAKDTTITKIQHQDPSIFVPPEGGVHEKPNDKCAKMCRRYVGSAIWRRFVNKKSGKKLQEKYCRGL